MPPKNSTRLRTRSKAPNYRLSDDEEDEEMRLPVPKSKSKSKRRRVDDEDDDAELSMFHMLQEYQKKKAAKAAIRSDFSAQRSVLFGQLRGRAALISEEGTAYIDQAHARVHELHAEENSPEDQLKILVECYQEYDDTVKNQFADYRLSLQALSRKRAHEIDAASALLENHTARRKKSLHRSMRNAKAHLEQGQKNKELAVDASNFIKHFKAILRS